MSTRIHQPLKYSGIILSLVLFALILFTLLFGINRLSASADIEAVKNMSEAITRNTVQCYAIEGKYPDDLGYLADHYNVALNEDKYVYHYTFLGDNIMPQIFVFLR